MADMKESIEEQIQKIRSETESAIRRVSDQGQKQIEEILLAAKAAVEIPKTTSELFAGADYAWVQDFEITDNYNRFSSAGLSLGNWIIRLCEWPGRAEKEIAPGKYRVLVLIVKQEA